MQTYAQAQAKARYDAVNMKKVGIKLHITNDADILALLEQSDNKQGLIKEALREYIENHK